MLPSVNAPTKELNRYPRQKIKRKNFTLRREAVQSNRMWNFCKNIMGITMKTSKKRGGAVK